MPIKLIFKFYDPEEIEKITNEQKEKIINLYLEDVSLRNIADQFECGITTIVRIVKEDKIIIFEQERFVL